MSNFKRERIAQILTEEINSMIVLGKIKDPRVSSKVSVLYVKVSKDCTSATVYISSFMAESVLMKTINALNHAKGFIQSEIHKTHKWRHTPRLFFKASDGLKQGTHIISTFHEHELKNDYNTDESTNESSNE